MLKIDKLREPEFFRTYVNKNKLTDWGELHKEPELITLKRLNKYILENEQTPTKSALCAYCERKVTTEKSHIEHIKPRSKFPNDIFSYNNLIVSCDDNNSCGKYKKSEWDEKFINPVSENLSAYSSYDFDGLIIPKVVDTSRADITINILNLNYSKLKDRRRTILLAINNYPEALVNSLNLYFHDFPSLIKWYQDSYNSIQRGKEYT
jgi:uncharacterized protein (TIGR02646 family)